MIEFTWISEATERQRSVVRVELRPMADDGTELVLTHQQLPTEKAAQERRGGWSAALDRLSERLPVRRA